MKNAIIVSLLCLPIGLSATAQTRHAAQKMLKPVLILKVDREGGANGANVAWHPVQKKYYAAMAGNESFPLMVYDARGNILNPATLNTMFDVRGLWYNPVSKSLQANGYDNFGWSEYKLDAKGIPVSSRKLSVLVSQPDPQSVAAYDPKKNVLYFYDYNLVSLELHNLKSGAIEANIPLHLGAVTYGDTASVVIDEIKNKYNQNTVIFTGVVNAEIGLLNVDDRQIELYNKSNGLLMQVLKLPDDAPAESSLNFSYTNGIYWLFNKTERQWHGYQ